MSDRNPEMSGVRKAAMLLVQLGPEHSARVMSKMRDTEIEELSAEIVQMGMVDGSESDQVLVEFHQLHAARMHVGQGGFEFARELLLNSVGVERAEDMLHRLTAGMIDLPFSFLQKADPRQLLSFLSDEHPQTIALVLAHLPAPQASAVLSGLAADLQADVAHRIALMESTSPDIIRQVEQMLERKLSSVLQPSDLSTVGGLQPLVDIINRADRTTERQIMEGLESRSPELAEQVRSKMFMFEDITMLDDRAVQQVLRQVETADLATALKGVRDDVREKVMRNMSERAAENLADEIEMLGPVRLRTVEESQAKVVQAIRALEASGQITIRRGDDDEFVA
jgi:flagellar motor switch protein FliG